MHSSPFRIGLGHDTHRLEPGGPLILGGLSLEHTRRAVGHSDADVLLHAITDAVLGAAALGDIGELFPDTDPANRYLCPRCATLFPGYPRSSLSRAHRLPARSCNA